MTAPALMLTLGLVLGGCSSCGEKKAEVEPTPAAPEESAAKPHVRWDGGRAFRQRHRAASRDAATELDGSVHE